MNRHHRNFTIISHAALTIALLTSETVFAQGPMRQWAASEINAANKLLRDGKIDEAIQSYRGIVPADQHQDQLNYNLAVAEYRKGNIDTAQQLFSEVAEAGDPAISADSRYNLGNCLYSKGVASADSDRNAAIDFLRQAISNYRSSLRVNPNNPDARANIELAAQLIRKLQDEQKREDEQDKKDQQAENQEQPNQQQSEQQESDPQQQDDSQKSEQKQSDKTDSQPSDSRQEGGEANTDHQKRDSQNERPEDKSEPQPDDPSPSSEQEKRDEQKDGDEQQQSEKQANDKAENQKPDSKSVTSNRDQSPPRDGQDPSPNPQTEGQELPEEPQENEQPIPTGELKSANEQENDAKPQGSAGMSDPNAKDGLMTREEALKLLQSVRDRDMLRRMQQLRRERSRHVPVDKDW